MNCPRCSHDNPMTVTYCQQCGGRLDLTADEIRQSFLDKARGEAVKSTAHYAKNLFMFGVGLLVFGFTLLVMSGGVPEKSYYIPSASNGAKYVEVKYDLEIGFPPLLIPLESPAGGGKK